jgi:GNAT superfamily N-acetyltransferase
MGATHHRMMQVREAAVEDAEETCRILRRSIIELCVPDHGNDPTFLEKWLSNKTPDHVWSWILHPNSRVFVAVESGVTVGVGAVTDQGEVTLNYVSPDTRFKGVSKAILGRIEREALALGNAACALTGTETARRFYLSAGYVPEGPGAADNRMVKQLSPAAPAV